MRLSVVLAVHWKLVACSGVTAEVLGVGRGVHTSSEHQYLPVDASNENRHLNPKSLHLEPNALHE